MTISVPGDVLESVDYTVTLRTNRGLYFDSSCSGASNQSREWRLSGRSRYERVYAVWACEGHTAGSLYVEMRRDDDPEMHLSNAISSVRIVTPTPTPTPTTRPTTRPTTKPTHTPTPTATPRPLPPDLILRAPHREDDQFPFNRVGCKELRPGTSEYDIEFGTHGAQDYAARLMVYTGNFPVPSVPGQGIPPPPVDCVIGFADHITRHTEDTAIDASIRSKFMSSSWKVGESEGIGCSGGGICRWENQPILFAQANLVFIQSGIVS